MSQVNLWQAQNSNDDFAELCNGLYQREINLLAKGCFTSAKAVQVRLQSLPHYITRTAHSMIKVVAQAESPLQLDCQNASWSAKQSREIPLSGQEVGQENQSVFSWYLSGKIDIGLVVPVQLEQYIILDCIDRVDLDKKRLRTNVGGWFYLTANNTKGSAGSKRLLKPNKKVMLAACAGHRWQGSNKLMPVIPSLRELLLSCGINWKNFKQPFLL